MVTEHSDCIVDDNNSTRNTIRFRLPPILERQFAKEKSSCIVSIGQTTTVIHRQLPLSILCFACRVSVKLDLIKLNFYAGNTLENKIRLTSQAKIFCRTNYISFDIFLIFEHIIFLLCEQNKGDERGFYCINLL